MSKRDKSLYIDDIIDSSSAIKEFIDDMSFEEFVSDRKTYSATIREYIIIGEAVSNLIEVLEERLPQYPWRMVKDFRNFIIHEYFGVDPQIVWDLTTQELDELVSNIQQLRDKQ
ncbi:MAG: hypothetical protein A3E21_09685 [Sulfurimonas sp. RIFCSPHIGHO2_12_FULL_36_9]|uniref:HepT-like ribonuclease domain-containing protein n=1 Tax=Sulfurimonas sp. RIFCSPLOWO2_12_36_12 TaxID=1802253 RepID=UPI0008B27F51|nr:DUF86 domain-containing protein [Sulfurimonas sp. RIFCSPLOWO2_12_36_12]OHD97515.1 MAG: hypothetical protein A3J26_05960 [Sulfurimonas sp. RIFCSPLOWO2_02_FULL_36_28]OHD99524.1 MAG: hypothetical protein A3E21_09685 [Sulfurimonas sp. RIFCSPHIGHO2_12_FULL_36_9]OHE00526.1 MAG: hypothetical protein A2W82_06960 [Sulfurimonas sp. RIFCSPLOWO2_12_36_12]OHE03128.1 MAG: hypothetical protein A3K14_10775 [Sulfurimonas sp. RIFCSPLOWO2_12_FULL_36_74]